MNLPNFLTILRIVLSVLFLSQISRSGMTPKCLALFFFLTASLTDYLDGWIARTQNQMTAFGRLMDPIADKVLSLSAFISFVQMGLVQSWMVIVIIARDLLITGLRLLMAPGSEKVGARSSGKHKTVLQFVAIVGILGYLVARESAGWIPGWNGSAEKLIFISMLAVVVMTLWSGIRYLVLNRDALKTGSS